MHKPSQFHLVAVFSRSPTATATGLGKDKKNKVKVGKVHETFLRHVGREETQELCVFYCLRVGGVVLFFEEGVG